MNGVGFTESLNLKPMNPSMDSFYGPAGSKAFLTVRIKFSDKEIVLPDPTGEYVWKDYVDMSTFPIDDDPDIEFSFESDKFVATLRRTSTEPVTIRASTYCPSIGGDTFPFSEYVIAGNIETPHRGITIGSKYGLALPPRRSGETFSVDIRPSLVNATVTERLLVLKLKITWNIAQLEMRFCYSPVAYGKYYAGCEWRSPGTSGTYPSGQAELWLNPGVGGELETDVSGLLAGQVGFEVITTETVVSTISVDVEEFKTDVHNELPNTNFIGKLDLNAPLLDCVKVDAGTCLDRNVHRGGSNDVCTCADDFYGSDFDVIRPPLSPPSPPSPPAIPPPPYSSPPYRYGGQFFACGIVERIQFWRIGWTFNPQKTNGINTGFDLSSITGVIGTQVQIKVAVLLNDPWETVYLPNPGRPEIEALVKLSTSYEEITAIEFDDNWVATLRGNSIKPVVITASTYCEAEDLYSTALRDTKIREMKYVYAETMVAGNIHDEHATDAGPITWGANLMIDIGAKLGLAIPPKRYLETFTVDIRANSGSLFLIALQMKLGFDPTQLSAKSCERGVDWQLELYCVHNVVRGAVKLSLISLDSQHSGTALHVATATFEVITTETVLSPLAGYVYVQEVRKGPDPMTGYDSLGYYTVEPKSGVYLNPPFEACKTMKARRPPHAQYCDDRRAFRGGYREDDDICPCADDFYASDWMVEIQLPPSPPPPMPPPSPPPLPPPPSPPAVLTAYRGECVEFPEDGPLRNGERDAVFVDLNREHKPTGDPFIDDYVCERPSSGGDACFATLVVIDLEVGRERNRSITVYNLWPGLRVRVLACTGDRIGWTETFKFNYGVHKFEFSLTTVEIPPPTPPTTTQYR